MSSVAFISLGRLITSIRIGSVNTDSNWTCKLPSCRVRYLDYCRTDRDVVYLVPQLYWDVAEVGMSVFAICLPAIFQLVRHGKQYGPRYLIRRKSPFTPYNMSRTAPQTGNENSKSCQPEWDSIYSTSMFGTFVSVSAGASARSPMQPRAGFWQRESHASDNHSGINVTRHIEVTKTRLGPNRSEDLAVSVCV